MKKIKILSKLITILSASFLVCSNFNAMENTKDKNLKTNNNVDQNLNLSQKNMNDSNNKLLNKKRNKPKNDDENNDDEFLKIKKNNPDDDENLKIINNEKEVKNEKNKKITEKDSKLEKQNNNNTMFEISKINDDEKDVKDDNKKVFMNALNDFSVPYPEYFNHIKNYFSTNEISNCNPLSLEKIKQDKDFEKKRKFILKNINYYINTFIEQNIHIFNSYKFVKNCFYELYRYNIHNVFVEKHIANINKTLEWAYFAKYVYAILSITLKEKNIKLNDNTKEKISKLRNLIFYYIKILDNLTTKAKEYFQKIYEDGLSSKYIADPLLNMIKHCLSNLVTAQEEDEYGPNLFSRICDHIYYLKKDIINGKFYENKIGFLPKSSSLHNFLFLTLISFISHIDNEINSLNKKLYNKKNINTATISIKKLYSVIDDFEKILDFEMNIVNNCEKYVDDYIENIKKYDNKINPTRLFHIKDATIYNKFIKITSEVLKPIIKNLKNKIKQQYLEYEKLKNKANNNITDKNKSLLKSPSNSNNINIKNQDDDIHPSLHNPNNINNQNYDDIDLINNLNNTPHIIQTPNNIHLNNKKDNLINLSLNDNVNKQKDDNINPLLNKLNSFNNIHPSPLNPNNINNQDYDDIDLINNFNNQNNNNINLPNNLFNTSLFPQIPNVYNINLFNNSSPSPFIQRPNFNNNLFNNLINTSLFPQIPNVYNINLFNNSSPLPFIQMPRLNNINLNNQINDNIHSSLDNLNNINLNENEQNDENLNLPLNNSKNIIFNIKKDNKNNLYYPLKYEKYDLQDLDEKTELMLNEEDYDDKKDDFSLINLSHWVDEQLKMKTFKLKNNDFSPINLSNWVTKQSIINISNLNMHFKVFYDEFKKTYDTIKNFKENNYINIKNIEVIDNSKIPSELYDEYNKLYSYSVVLDILVRLADNFYNVYDLTYEAINNENLLNIDNTQQTELNKKIEDLKKSLPLIKKLIDNLKNLSDDFHNKVEKAFPLKNFHSNENFIKEILADDRKILKEILNGDITKQIEESRGNISRLSTKKRLISMKAYILRKINETNKKFEFYLKNRLNLIKLANSLSIRDNLLGNRLLKQFETNQFITNIEEINKNITKLLKTESLKVSKIDEKNNIDDEIKKDDENHSKYTNKKKVNKTIAKKFTLKELDSFFKQKNYNFDILHEKFEKKKKDDQNMKNSQNIKDKQKIEK